MATDKSRADALTDAKFIDEIDRAAGYDRPTGYRPRSDENTGYFFTYGELADLIRGLLVASLAEQHEAAPAEELSNVHEVLASGKGFWRTCSGCHESEDGHPVGEYPYSDILQCDLGAGCTECGGIGAVWDNTDYDDLVDFLEKREADADAKQPEPLVANERSAPEWALRVTVSKQCEEMDAIREALELEEDCEYSVIVDAIQELREARAPSSNAAGAEGIAHEIWAAAQLTPGEGIEDGARRIAAILPLAPARAAEPVALEITEQAAADWASRHDVDHVLKHFSTQRNAIEDARTLHLVDRLTAEITYQRTANRESRGKARER
ncbi:hypothetical protein LGM58_34205 [Burkholderia contaminans]|uniref:hypothetical protein n=1 Tax=Burkholderia contaminans TaxID=488447 RepID=UPI001CF575F3|nr:hypothetical protein [Burkholderia contaminans]MCA7888235.1 hypothetical protein [Burkholderia contaminans]